MEKVREIEGRAYPYGAKNVDTDVIIPAEWLKTITREGLGKGAFESVRAQPGNVFDDERYAGSPILIAGDNFGCGSSREHAASKRSLHPVSPTSSQEMRSRTAS